MTWLRRLALVLALYAGVVAAFEGLVAFMGARQASRGLQPDDRWIVIATTDADGRTQRTVVAGVESEGRLYVSANHWPRAWHARAVAHPDVEITVAGATSARRAVPIDGDERARVARDYPLPLWARLLTGFPPRTFLRLDPR